MAGVPIRGRHVSCEILDRVGLEELQRRGYACGEGSLPVGNDEIDAGNE